MVRPFNNYGPGLKITDGRVIPDFARNIFAGDDIVMFSDGAPSRTFCYVADAVVGYYKALVRGCNGEAYNIGVEEPEITMRELAERIIGLGRELHGYAGRLVLGASVDADYLVDNPARRCPSIDKARRELGYQPGISLEDGLRRSLLWYAEHRTGEEN
jgi:nucleoside-diphosphate-sugar epimerase